MSLDKAIPELWHNRIQKNLYHNSVMAGLVKTTFQDMLKSKGGDTVYIPSVDDVTVREYTGADIQVEDGNITNQKLVVDQKKYVAVRINNIVKAQTNLALMNDYRKKARIATKLVIDTYLLGSQADVDSGNIIGSVVAPINLTESNIYGYFVDLFTALRDADALDGDTTPWAVIPPTIEGIVKKSEQFTHATPSADKVIRNGNIGKLAGFDIHVSSNNVPVSGKHNILAGVPDAIEFVLQIEKASLVPEEKNFGDIYKMLLAFGRKTVQAKQLAKLVAAA